MYSLEDEVAKPAHTSELSIDQLGTSRTNSVDSALSASKLSSDLFSRQSVGSRHSTKSALSALLAAVDQNEQTHLDSASLEFSDGEGIDLPRSKSNSRSNSVYSSLHSGSDHSLTRPRSTRFEEHSSGDEHPADFTSLPNDNDHVHTHSQLNHKHAVASDSARRILASASFDSDLSDGGMGIEYSPHPLHHHEQLGDSDAYEESEDEVDGQH